MAAIRITIGARLDPASSSVFAPLIAQAERARATIGSIGKKTTEEFVGGYRTAPARTKAGFDGVTKQAEQSSKAIVAAAKRADAEKAASAEHVFQIKMRHLAAEEAAEKSSAERRQKTIAGIMSRGASGAVGMARGALGFTGQIARGLGVNMDVGSLMGKVSSQQAASIQIANSGYVEGEKGPTGVRQDAAGITKQSREVADKARMSTDDVQAGLQAFTGKTTDLETGRAILERMAIQAKTTGSNMGDVMGAAAEVSIKLGDGYATSEDKANAVARVMSVIAKQGKLGASEMSSMVTQMAKLTGPSRQFGANVEESISDLGAVFQITKKYGGVNGPAQAGTSVSALVNGLKSQAGRRALKKANIGIDPDDLFEGGAKGDHKTLKGLSTIIPLLLDKTKGDLTKLSAAIPNVRANAVMTGFGDIYNSAEAKKKGSGKDAAAQVFKDYSGQTSKADTDAALAAVNGDTVSKVQLLNNELEKVAEKTAAGILPAMEKLAPRLIQVAEGLGKMAVFVAENPAKAIVLAITASFAKELAAAGIKSILQGALGGNGGAALAGITIAAATATLITESMNKDVEKGEASGSADVDATDTTIVKAAKELRKTGSLSPETKADLEKARGDVATQTADAGNAGRSTVARAGDWLASTLGWGKGGGTADMARENELKANVDQGRVGRQGNDIKALLDGTAAAHIAAAVAAGMKRNGPQDVRIVGGAQPGTTGPAPPHP